MQIKKITFALLTISLALIAFQDSLAQRRTRNIKSKPVMKSRQTQTVTVTKNESTGETEVGTTPLLGTTTPRQNLYFGPVFRSSKPDTIDFHIFSYANDYQYADHSYIDILVNGESILSKNYQPSRMAGTENGLAVEILTVPLSFYKFESLISATRVDVVINWYTKFTISNQNLNIMKSFHQKTLPIADTARIGLQEALNENFAKQKLLKEEDEKRKKEEERLKIIANEEVQN